MSKRTQILLGNMDIHSWLKCYKQNEFLPLQTVFKDFCMFYNIVSHDDCPITFRSVPPPFWMIMFKGG